MVVDVLADCASLLHSYICCCTVLAVTSTPWLFSHKLVSLCLTVTQTSLDHCLEGQLGNS